MKKSLTGSFYLFKYTLILSQKSWILFSHNYLVPNLKTGYYGIFCSAAGSCQSRRAALERESLQEFEQEWNESFVLGNDVKMEKSDEEFMKQKI
jgi:hypothetical protein